MITQVDRDYFFDINMFNNVMIQMKIAKIKTEIKFSFIGHTYDIDLQRT